MKLILVAQSAFRGLSSNLGRSFLSVLGIVIGIVAIVLVVALGEGAQQLILNEIQSIGGNTIILRPGKQPEGPSDMADTLFADSLKNRDIEALKRPENVPGLANIAPAVVVPGNVSYRSHIYRPVMFGWTSDAMVSIFNILPEKGEYFTQDDVKQRAKVVVIGWRVKKELFGDSDAVGKFIKVKEKRMRVVAVLPKVGQVSFMNFDEIVLLPYTTAQKDLLGINYINEVMMKAKDGTDIDQVAADIKATMRELHNISDPSKDDFYVVTQKEMTDMVGNITQVLTIFLVAMASISLIVGGVGIMNIMMVSVTERTREIGLRKAVGATNQDIMKHFLLEAIILTLGGGIIGVAIAITLSYVVAIIVRTQYNLDWPISIPLGAIVLGVGTAVMIGLVFGIYPAKKAACKDPIDSLRYE